MQTVDIGNTLVNDVMLGSQRMDDVLQQESYTIEYLVVAGGAGGGSFASSRLGGGGGAGGFLSGSANVLSTKTYKIAVGGAGTSNGAGRNSYLTGSGLYFDSIGGGAGGSGNANGNAGGSGGGAGAATTGTRTGGTGIVGQGTDGGNSDTSTAGNGGGANRTSTITGTSVTYAAGGGQGGPTGDAAPNTGNGGFGGIGSNTGGKAGGSGIVAIRYLGSQKGTGGVVTTDGNFTIHTFTASLANRYQAQTFFDYIG